MSVNISQLHNILRDETRDRILQLLDQKSSLSYVELQSLLEIHHTGKLNYHLKVLGDLLVKDEQTGRYSLAEKGKIAVELLSKFQEATALSDARRSLATGLMLVSLIAGVMLLSFLTQFVSGYSGIGRALYGIGWAGIGLLAAWLFGRRSPLRTFAIPR
jgi:hypothetical protein